MEDGLFFWRRANEPEIYIVIDFWVTIGSELMFFLPGLATSSVYRNVQAILCLLASAWLEFYFITNVLTMPPCNLNMTEFGYKSQAVIRFWFKSTQFTACLLLCSMWRVTHWNLAIVVNI